MANRYFKPRVIKIGYNVDLDITECDVKLLSNMGGRFLKVLVPDTFNLAIYREFLKNCIKYNIVPVLTIFNGKDHDTESSLNMAKIRRVITNRIDNNIIIEFHNDIGITIEKYYDEFDNLILNRWGDVIRICKRHLEWCNYAYSKGLMESNIMCSITEGFSRETGERVRIRTSDSMAGSVNGELDPETWKPTHVKKDMEIILNYYNIDSVWDLHGQIVPPMEKVDHFTRAIFKKNSKQFSFTPSNIEKTTDAYIEIAKKIKGRLPKGIITGACIFVYPGVDLSAVYKKLYGEYPENYNRWDNTPEPEPEPEPQPEPEPEIEIENESEIIIDPEPEPRPKPKPWYIRLWEWIKKILNFG
jgi:hypothetical protein